ncbi:MAG: DNA-processing protein DprA [Myxococcaceae bacterium]
MSQTALAFGTAPRAPVSTRLELGAYEALWAREGMSFKKLAELFQAHPGELPSEVLGDKELAERAARQVLEILRARGVTRFGVRLHGAGEYPAKLRSARFPVELLYFQGWWNLTESPSVAVVGTRKPTAEGLRRARKLVQALVEDKRTVVSGLAAGVDTAAHNAALEAGGRTIAVIGTPLGWVYPRENLGLQERIAREFLLVSQVPVLRYSQHGPGKASWRLNTVFFPERNLTMSALTDATIIVEAGETSGTLIQARAALEQGRTLFILDSCFKRGLKWPERYLAKGAVRVKGYEDVRAELRLARVKAKEPAQAELPV